MSLPIEDYALIGDTRTAALVGRNGSIDWLCVPRFDSPACFAALLGEAENGRWLLAPAGGQKKVHRRYRDATLVLDTEFETEDGSVLVTDFMAHPHLDGQVDIIRIVQGRSGKVPMHMELTLRFGYGSIVPWVRRREYGLRAVAGPNAVRFQSPVELVNSDFRTLADFAVEAGQMLPFRFTWVPSHEYGPRVGDVEDDLEDCQAWWHDWASQCTVEGEWREDVVRSLITLKALTYSPSGGIIAAATTSLPEQLGGGRNWDYRFCWIRDATFTLDALGNSGFIQEARAWRQWLLRAVAGRPSQLQIMYSVVGERQLEEREIAWLPGYANSRPVRVGNGAHSQLQLDVFGEIMDAFHEERSHGVAPLDDAWRLQCTLLTALCELWREKDSGIWEMRGPPRHFTHSKVMAWVAFDRAIKAVENFGSEGPCDDWRKVRQEIFDDVVQHGYDEKRNSFVQYYGGKALDASLLMIPLVGFLPADDPRVIGTVDAIGSELCRDGLLMRYSTDAKVDGLSGGEGAFVACSFWLVDVLCLLDRRDEGRALFKRLLSMRNEVGLLAEEYDIAAGRQVGNFPQAFSHVALINTANNLMSRRGPAHRRAGD
ncbi:MAG: glycoside hydrolase family 15 protein [Rhodospirillales bacterium]|nr:glycoside hydrolase family 15 protein [Rhodospirillales bacterium]